MYGIKITKGSTYASRFVKIMIDGIRGSECRHCRETTKLLEECGSPSKLANKLIVFRPAFNAFGSLEHFHVEITDDPWIPEGHKSIVPRDDIKVHHTL